MIIKPGDPEFGSTQDARQRQLNRIAKASDKATDGQWQMVEFAIKAWIQAYPRHWMKFQKELMAGRSKYNEAKGGDLKAARWRNSASFPIAYIPDPVTGELQSNSLLQVLNKIIPHLTHKNSVNYTEFLRRFPAFRPSEKTNASDSNRIVDFALPTVPKVEEKPKKATKAKAPTKRKAKDNGKN